MRKKNILALILCIILSLIVFFLVILICNTLPTLEISSPIDTSYQEFIDITSINKKEIDELSIYLFKKMDEIRYKENFDPLDNGIGGKILLDELLNEYKNLYHDTISEECISDIRFYYGMKSDDEKYTYDLLCYKCCVMSEDQWYGIAYFRILNFDIYFDVQYCRIPFAGVLYYKVDDNLYTYEVDLRKPFI